LILFFEIGMAELSTDLIGLRKVLMEESGNELSVLIAAFETFEELFLIVVAIVIVAIVIVAIVIVAIVIVAIVRSHLFPKKMNSVSFGWKICFSRLPAQVVRMVRVTQAATCEYEIDPVGCRENYYC